MKLNNPVQRYDHTTFFDELNMKETIFTTYTGKGTSTTNLFNQSNYLIDGIQYISGSTVISAGCSKFKESIPSDHRILWVEFPLMDIFGKKITSFKKGPNLKRVTQGIYRNIIQI